MAVKITSHKTDSMFRHAVRTVEQEPEALRATRGSTESSSPLPSARKVATLPVLKAVNWEFGQFSDTKHKGNPFGYLKSIKVRLIVDE